jgi:hypothetical protein
MSSGISSTKFTLSDELVEVDVVVDELFFEAAFEDSFPEAERSISDTEAEDGVEVMERGFCFFMSTKLILSLVTGSIKGEINL